MKRKAISILLITIMLLGGIFSAGQAGVSPTFRAGEIHRRFGAFIAGPLDVNNLSGRPQTPSAVIQTDAGVVESFYVFPALSTFEGVDQANFYLLSRGGEYTGEIWLSMDVYGIDGSYKRSLTSEIDLATAPTGVWHSLALNGNNSLAPFEFLVAHFVYSAGAGGTMELRPIFDVKTFSGFRAYLTLVRR